LFLSFTYVGGCTVTLVKKSSVKKCIEAIQKGYKGKANFYEFEPCDGARPIDIKKLNDK
jgi:galactokinase